MSNRTISGTVTRQPGEKKLAGVEVLLLSVDAQGQMKIASKKSNASGKYSFKVSTTNKTDILLFPAVAVHSTRTHLIQSSSHFVLAAAGDVSQNMSYRSVEILPGNLPAAPTNLTVTGATPAPPRIDLAWNAVPGVTGYKVQRKDDTADWADVGRTAANVTTFSDTTVVVNKPYRYRVFATNTAGDSAPSNTVDATAGSAPILDPALVTKLKDTIDKYLSEVQRDKEALQQLADLEPRPLVKEQLTGYLNNHSEEQAKLDDLKLTLPTLTTNQMVTDKQSAIDQLREANRRDADKHLPASRRQP